jgi:hypothetical protein
MRRATKFGRMVRPATSIASPLAPKSPVDAEILMANRSSAKYETRYGVRMSPRAVGTAAKKPPNRGDHGFCTWFAIAAFAVVVVGFARSYYLKAFFGTAALPWLVHLHGALMTSWFALFFVQTSLIATHRVHLHKRLGILGAVLAGLIVIVGTEVALRHTARVLHRPTHGGHPLQFMGFILAVLFVFAILVGAALLMRRRRDWHKRLMLLSCLSLIGPGLTRIPLQWFHGFAFLESGGPAGLFGLDLLLVYACIAWDTWHHRRLHPAFVCGALLIFAYDLPFIGMFLSSSTWTHFAMRLVS